MHTSWTTTNGGSIVVTSILGLEVSSVLVARVDIVQKDEAVCMSGKYFTPDKLTHFKIAFARIMHKCSKVNKCCYGWKVEFNSQGLP